MKKDNVDGEATCTTSSIKAAKDGIESIKMSSFDTVGFLKALQRSHQGNLTYRTNQGAVDSMNFKKDDLLTRLDNGTTKSILRAVERNSCMRFSKYAVVSKSLKRDSSRFHMID